jgi:hypothetical protein
MNLLKVLQHNGGPWLRAPANSVRRAQVLTKVHLPRSRARVASFMAIVRTCGCLRLQSDAFAVG